MSSSAETHENFIELLTKHEPVIRASIRAVIRRSEDVDEVMQSVSLVAWRRFDSVTDVAGFAKWACVIARYEILKFQRSKARDRLQLDEALVAKLIDEGAEDTSARAQRIANLENCLNGLPSSRRALILHAYSPGTSMKVLAESSGKTPEGLYQLLRRIRVELKRCMDATSMKKAELM